MGRFSNYLEYLGLSETEAASLCPLARSRKLAKAQFLKAAYDELAHSDTAVTPSDVAQALTWLRKSGELQQAHTYFSTLTPKLKRDPRVLLEYMFVLAATGRFQDLQTTLRYFLRTGCDQYTDFGQMLALAPFASHESLRDLSTRVILDRKKQGKPSWFHFLYELTARRGLSASASTLLEVYEGTVIDTGNAEEALCFRSNLAFRRGDFVEQNRFLSEAISSHGLLPTELKNREKPFSVLNLETREPAFAVTDGPLVTVLIATYNVAETIGTVCRSLLSQTYRNLELIVVDDASTDTTRDIFRKLSEEDHRIRFFPLERNQGTYTAFNHGLIHAKGDYVTCQGADDWAHPEKISTLVDTLALNPGAIASKARKIRCAESDGLESSPSGYVTRDMSSLTYRRVPAAQALGFYDTVRCSGDTEFMQRLRYRFGANSIVDVPAITGVCDWSSNGLTGGHGFTVLGPFASPARTEYRRCFREWHEKARLSGDLHIPFPHRPRKFPAPADVLPGRALE